MHLDLLAAGDPAMQAPTIVQDAVNNGEVLGRDRPGEFASHHVMRKVGGESHVGEPVQQVQCKEQIGGHAVAMRLDMHLHARLRREPAPAFDIGLPAYRAAHPAAG
jgi:hypothetical protein